MTCDHTPRIMSLVEKHGFGAVQVIMKNTHHARISELVITPRPVFSDKVPSFSLAAAAPNNVPIPRPRKR